jgi:cytochrome c
VDSFELNKILGAVLGMCLCATAVHIAAGAIFAVEPPAKPGYAVAVNQPEKPQAGAAKEQPEESIATLLASANADRGKADIKVCSACHSFDKGGPNMVGPDLWGVVGRPRASVPGFDYSPAMKAKGGTWTFDELNQFLAKPQSYIPGTKMTFGGFDRAAQRADVIAYLRTLSDQPVPLPAASAPPAAQPNSHANSQAANQGTAAPEKQPEKPIGARLASANVDRGKADTKICSACHNFEKGGPNLVGPDLWGVVDRPRASEPGYDYSPAMKAKGGKWTFDELDKFLTNPGSYVPGTKMTFGGFDRPAQRADVIAYLRTLSDNPAPLPATEGSAPQPK